MRAHLLLFLLLSACLGAAPTAIPTFTTTHAPDDAEQGWFTFPSGDTDLYYTNPMVAVAIEAVYADGVTLTPMPIDSAARNDLDTKTYRPVLPARMLYRLNCREVVTARSRDINGALEFKRYDIPMDAKKIEISYRVRYPNGRISQEMMLVSLIGYEFKSINDK